jgi:hypothetical protein
MGQQIGAHLSGRSWGSSDAGWRSGGQVTRMTVDAGRSPSYGSECRLIQCHERRQRDFPPSRPTALFRSLGNYSWRRSRQWPERSRRVPVPPPVTPGQLVADHHRHRQLGGRRIRQGSDARDDTAWWRWRRTGPGRSPRSQQYRASPSEQTEPRRTGRPGIGFKPQIDESLLFLLFWVLPGTSWIFSSFSSLG